MAGMTDFEDRRKPAWDDLNALLLRAGGSGGLRRLTRDELRRLGPLYRRAAADLAYARLRGADPRLVAYLNELVGRAHGLLYSERGPGAARLWRFLTVGFPRLLRARRGYVLMAALTFLLGGVLGAVLTASDPEMIRVLLPSRADDPDFYAKLPETISEGERPAFSALLMQNNIRVAFVAFALGILGGFPTLMLLFTNGLPIGSLAVQQHHAGYSTVLWSFLLPHGVPELTAIFIAGGAGMMIGHALIAPGELARRDALVLAARDAVRLVLGTILLFVVAGLVESFVSPTALPPAAKFAFAGLMAVGLAAYCNAGRERADAPAAPAADEAYPPPDASG